jgi:hypothetical protein
MAVELDKEQLQRLARLGARARLAELEAERLSILRAFPDLAPTTAIRTRGKSEPVAAGGVPAPAPGRAVRHRRKRTAAERKAASERMKQVWSERRKQA